MSWFGEQLTSITGKLTDFTKEVLIESSGLLSPEGDGQNAPVPQEYAEHSPETLLQLLQEKDSKIEQLTKEKNLCDKNIEKLDEQHQEEVHQLLLQRSRLVKENHELKEKLETLEARCRNEPEKDSFPTSDSISCTNVQDTIQNSLLNEHGNFYFELDKTDLNHDYDNINLFSLLCSLRNCSDSKPIEEGVHSLENKRCCLTRLLQKSDSEEVTEYIERTTKNIDIYINYLKLALNHSNVFLPVIRENGVILHLLHSRSVSLEENINSLASEVTHLNDVIRNFNEKEKRNEGNFVVDSSTQFTSVETIDFIQRNAIDVGVGTISSPVESRHSQTDSSLKCENCTINEESINTLQCNIENCIQQIHLLKQEAACANSKCSSNSVQTQTNSVCKCDFLTSELNKQKIKFEKLQTVVDEKENSFTVNLQKEVSRYTELLDAFKEQEILLEAKEKNINDKNSEISMLKSKFSELKEGVNIINLKQSDKSLSESDNEKMDITCKTYVGKECYAEKRMLSDHRISVMGKTSEMSYMEKLANEDLKLHEQLKKSELEKERILCVLNEKTQECSSLKAEVHRLTAIVASEKQALLKLQQDNQELKRIQQDSLDPELTKEALQNLSRIIRDKDIEMEALKQKNESLSSLIQQPSSFSTEHLQSVMEECENLTKQLNICKAEQERYMRTCSSKEQECQKYLAEVQRLTSLLSCESEKYDVLQQQHHSVSQQYEEKQKSLINTQNEMIALKQRVTDLEQQQIDIKEKYSELLNKINSDVLIQVHKEEYNSKLSEIESLKTSSKEKDDLIHEKDCIIHELSQQIKKHKADLDNQEQAFSDQQRENSDLLVKLSDAEKSLQKLQEEKETLNQRLNDKHAELGLQKEMNERLNMTISEKEFCIQSMGKKITSLSQIIQGNVSSSAESPYNCDIDQILAESDLMYTKAEHFQRERDESLLSLSQSQHENQELKSEVQKLKSTEEHLKSELDRLRQHLLQIEENYTSEALRAEEREKELRNQLAELENRTRTKCSAVIDASHEANVQVSSLQEQLGMIANQRDRALAQVSTLDDKVQQYVASLNNLQLVLEQMGKGHKQKVAQVEKNLLSKLDEEKEKRKKLEQSLQMRQMQLTESSQALEAASRLSEQLDTKEEVIAILRCELQRAENKFRTASEQIESIKSNTEGKVDRVVIKSLVLGYFSTPPGQKSEVVRLLARVLDFNQEEMEKAGIIVSRSNRSMEQKGIFSSLFGRLPSLVNSTQPRNVVQQAQPEKSFTSLFVQFLENESQPINPIPLPAEKMANEVTSKKSHSLKTQQPANAPLLLNLVTSFPTFTPVPVSDSGSPAPSILKEVLK